MPKAGTGQTVARFRIRETTTEMRKGGTVLIDRGRGLFSVKQFNRPGEFTLPLATVASMVVSKVIKERVKDVVQTKRKLKVRGF